MRFVPSTASSSSLVVWLKNLRERRGCGMCPTKMFITSYRRWRREVDFCIRGKDQLNL